MKPDIIIPTCKNQYQIAPLVCDVEGYSIGCRVIRTCEKASAAKNRNIGLEAATTPIVIMIDDDIAGFWEGWWEELIAPLNNPAVMIVSARLMKVDGTIGPMMFAGDTEVDGITEVPRVPTAAIAFRKTELRFCELYKHSGFEDDHFCAEMQERFPAGKIVINNRCKLIHINEQKGQSEGWEENKKIFDSIWETSKDGRTRTRKKMKTSPSYHSEYGEDKWLEENVFKGKTGGVFFEAGAIDGIVCSNTLFFEQERGWTGLCVEANPVMFAELKRNRSCKVDNVAIYDRDGEIDFMAVEGPLTGWGGIVEAIEKKHEERMEKEIPRGCRYKTTVPCITLEGMLRKHNLNKIDLLSLDIEGAEFKVLEKFPFNEFDIEVFAIENNFGTYPFEALMSSNGYEKIINLGVTEIYQRHT